MERRTFLKMLGAVSAASVIPSAMLPKLLAASDAPLKSANAITYPTGYVQDGRRAIQWGEAVIDSGLGTEIVFPLEMMTIEVAKVMPCGDDLALIHPMSPTRMTVRATLGKRVMWMVVGELWRPS